MDKLDWTKFTKRIAVRSDLSSVYNFWTISRELEKWFLSKASFYDENKKGVANTVNAGRGAMYEWCWFSQETPETGYILEANGKDFIRFTFAGECVVEVALIPKKDFILIELTQKEIPDDEISKLNIRLGCAFGWAFYLVNLKSLLEGGIDLRNKDKRFTNLVNN